MASTVIINKVNGEFIIDCATEIIDLAHAIRSAARCGDGDSAIDDSQTLRETLDNLQAALGLTVD